MTDSHAESAPASSTDLLVCITDLAVKKSGHVICQLSGLAVGPGERVGIIGANGSGKTTLLRVLAGFERDFTGQCDPGVASAECVFVHQAPILFQGTVLQNVTYGLAARSIPRSKRRGMGLEWLHQLGLAGFEDRNVRELSGGERRRVALARAAILQPKLLLLDEPLADLDESGINCVRQLLLRLTVSTILIASPTMLPDELVSRTVQLDLQRI